VRPADAIFIDPTGNVTRIFDVSDPRQAPLGQVLTALPVSSHGRRHRQVFGIVTDAGKGLTPLEPRPTRQSEMAPGEARASKHMTRALHWLL
jgi:hypothetical protein